MVNPQVWSEIPNSHVRESIGLGEDGKSGDDNGETNVAQKNEFRIFGFIERTGWVEVVNATGESIFLSNSSSLGLLLVMVVTRDIGEQV